LAGVTKSEKFPTTSRTSCRCCSGWPGPLVQCSEGEHIAPRQARTDVAPDGWRDVSDLSRPQILRASEEPGTVVTAQWQRGTEDITGHVPGSSR